MKIKQNRHSGILLHISSLPGPCGIGDLGVEAYAMADLLAKTGFDHWQILPLGPTGFGNSPYASRSTFAGNELFIDVRKLVTWKLLKEDQIFFDEQHASTESKNYIDYEAVISYKIPLLKMAAQQFMSLGPSGIQFKQFQSFCKIEEYWLHDYALFMTLFEEFGDARWFSHWPSQYAKRDEASLFEFSESHEQQIQIWKILQFFFHIQWKEFRTYVNNMGIKIIGDIPIFVASDSVDTWSNKHLFKTDASGNFSAVSGVPPDFFSATGQLWGNPVYDWNVCSSQSYQWWMERLSKILQFVDVIRIDHFRGFEAYWEIPAGSPTAEYGSWIHAPGKDFFQVMQKRLGTVPIIAEDLGVVTPSVEQLRDMYGFPGMKVYQFGFILTEQGKLDGHEEFLPHNYPYQCVAYTGTHDNDTTRGWFEALSPEIQKVVCEYLDCEPEAVVSSMIRTLIASHARNIIIPIQDIFNLDTSARMNKPSTCGSLNWSWRVTEELLLEFPVTRLRNLLFLYGRYPLT
jgi:4-alpha-glucanotransferase